ncbi:Mitochondrial translocator assembly and maintenance protein 41 [Cladochytrium tenue]|nr:Mitochondrial translocator assembly and maintenance protein 41 [Cladochytrium tenue]
MHASLLLPPPLLPMATCHPLHPHGPTMRAAAVVTTGETQARRISTATTSMQVGPTPGAAAATVAVGSKKPEFTNTAAEPTDASSVWADARLIRLIDHFDAPVRFAAAYGSGVVRQAGYDLELPDAKRPMVDLIFAVTHPYHWHSLNMRQNRHHYSFLASMGSRVVSHVQEYGAHIYYNTHVVVDGMKIKYGVISMDRLLRDLTSWETLYVAGRMQKPIKILRGDSRVKLANDSNLANAVRVALLSLPMEFSEVDFYKAIVGISYLGDVRMAVGAENPRKVHNIVAAQLPLLRALYSPAVAASPNLAVGASPWSDRPVHEEDPRLFNAVGRGDGALMRQDDDPRARTALVAGLPSALVDRLAHRVARESATELPPEGPRRAEMIARSPAIQDHIKAG